MVRETKQISRGGSVMKNSDEKLIVRLFKSITHPKVVRFRTAQLYQKRTKKDHPVTLALREALNSTMLDRKPMLEQYHRLYRLCGYVLIVSGLYLRQSPWINEKKASVEVAKRLAYDCPELKNKVEALLDE